MAESVIYTKDRSLFGNWHRLGTLERTGRKTEMMDWKSFWAGVGVTVILLGLVPFLAFATAIAVLDWLLGVILP